MRKQKEGIMGEREVGLSENMAIGLFEFYICPWIFFWGFL